MDDELEPEAFASVSIANAIGNLCALLEVAKQPATKRHLNRTIELMTARLQPLRVVGGTVTVIKGGRP